MTNLNGSAATLVKSEVDFQRLINGENERLVSRASNLLQNKSFTDVTFIVGPPAHSKKYVGHRVLLAMTSPVFEAMFYGDMADKSKVVRIPDLAPVGFENLLRYAYTDSLNLNCVEDAMLTAHAAKKYLLPHLLRECLAYIEKNVTPSSACAVYEFALPLNAHQLIYQAMQIIDRQTYHVITHKSFSAIQLSTLELITSRKYLNLYSEYSLFNAVIQWALSEAKRRSGNTSDWSVMRAILEESNILRNLRFLTMSAEEFTRAVAQTSGPQNGHIEADHGQLSPAFPPFENTFMTNAEALAVFMNLAVPAIKGLPKVISPEVSPRAAPPEYFVVKRYKPVTYATTSSLTAAQSGGKSVKVISVKFTVTNADLYLVGAAIPIRLDPGFYSVRQPKLECQMKFVTKAGISSDTPMGVRLDEAVLLDTIDDSISVSMSKDKDCHVRLKKPISVRRGNLNELLLTFHSSPHITDDIIVVKGHKNKPLPADIVDDEGIGWSFAKTGTTEFNEIYYYY
ncbi:BTB/POZ domain-containing protein 6-B [Halotydeus destructor]|nr:BTB/POZ domain-containing protein 6-B [Halotydeus destructor]